MLPAPDPAGSFNYAAVLPDTATAMREDLDLCRADFKSMTDKAIKQGRILIRWKGKLKHGLFLEWVEKEWPINIRTAEHWMKAAKFVEGKNEIISFLPITMLSKLAAKSTPAELRKEVIDRVESGGRVSTRELKDALADAAHQKRQAERKAEDEVRRSRKSKRALAKQEAKRRTYEAQEQKRQEGFRVVALSIIDTIGEVHARFLLETLGSNLFEIYEHLGLEVRKLGDQPPRPTESNPKRSSAENGRDDHIVADLGEAFVGKAAA